MIAEAIAKLVDGHDLTEEEAGACMDEIMAEQATAAQFGAFVVALRLKGETVDEITGMARAMRDKALRVRVEGPLLDTCGTGGDGKATFNASTAAAFVAAGAGAKVAKHGNRAMTSACGSADVLEAAGVNLSLDADAVAQCINAVGLGFMFAPAHHSAMKHVIKARKEIGVRTVFNLLGPLTNPAAAPNQIIGVFDPDWIGALLEVLRELGSNHVLIVSAEDGLDEISISAPTQVGELKDGEISSYSVSPADFGISQYDDYSMLQIDSVEASLAMLKQALSYENQAAGDIVALNAGAAIYAANLCDDLVAGVERAKAVLHTADAVDKLEQLVQFTQSVGA
ncbi:MAG: anthranilate phosphoribosyltransferase [Chloroflexi bacterium]|nr:anthranilate phosphoribosyltransferase [Chloroflexota bacterium]